MQKIHFNHFLNGCAKKSNIILTERQLQNWRENKWARDLFRVRCRTRSILFSGFGSQEPQIRHTVLQVKEAVALRMLNIPRVIAEGLAEQWRQTGEAELSKAGEWLATVSSEQWERALPRGAKISGQEAKTLWEILDGRLSWKQAFG